MDTSKAGRTPRAPRKRGSIAACSRLEPSPTFSSPMKTQLVPSWYSWRSRGNAASQPSEGSCKFVAPVRVHHTEVQIARDVLEVAPVLQPGTSHRNVVGGELAPCLHKNRQAEVAIQSHGITAQATEGDQSWGSPCHDVAIGRRSNEHGVTTVKTAVGRISPTTRLTSPPSGQGCRSEDRNQRAPKAQRQTPSPATSRRQTWGKPSLRLGKLR